MRTLYGWQNYHTSKFDIDINRNAGQTGAHIGYEGKRKAHLETYPVWTTTVSIDYHNILEEAIDINYYHPGEVAVGYGEIEFHHRHLCYSVFFHN